MQRKITAGIRTLLPSGVDSLLRRATVTVSLLAFAALANAQLILSIPDADQSGLAGTVFTFAGTITNNTGTTLHTSDLFLDFAGFDPAFLTPHQLLGSFDSTIADGSTSASLQLFDLALASGAMPGPLFSSDVTVQMRIGDLSDPVQSQSRLCPNRYATLLFVSVLPFAWYVGRRRRGHC